MIDAVYPAADFITQFMHVMLDSGAYAVAAASMLAFIKTLSFVRNRNAHH